MAQCSHYESSRFLNPEGEMYQATCKRGMWATWALFGVVLVLLLVASEAPAQVEYLTIFGESEPVPDDSNFGEAIASGDIDGDGNLDLVVGAPRLGAYAGNGNHGAVYVFHGPFPDNQQPTTPLRIFDSLGDAASAGASIAYAATFLDQVSGPGLPVFLAGAPGAGERKVWGMFEIGDVPQTFSLSPGANNYYFGNVVAVCDFNGDSYSDIAVRTGLLDASATPQKTSEVYVYLGGPGADGIVDIIIRPATLKSYFGYVMRGVEDVTGDVPGTVYGDLLIGSGYAAMQPESVHVVFGRAATQAADGFPAVITVTGDASEIGVNTISATNVNAVAGGVDLTGNGSRDIVVSMGPTSNFRQVAVYEGPIAESGIGSPVVTFEDGSSFGSTLAVDGDVNGDGFNDILIGSKLYTSYGTNVGRVTVALGGDRLPTGAVDCTNVLSTRNVWQLQPAAMNNFSQFGASVGYVGDQDGSDGRDEIFVGVPGADNPDPGVLDRTGKIALFNLSRSEIEIADFALPIPTGPSCTGPREFSVQIDVPQDVTLDSVVANSAALGLSNVALTDPEGDGVYSVTLSGTFLPQPPATVEVFARANTVASGFAIKNVTVDFWGADAIPVHAEYPVARSGATYPLVAVKLDPCGGMALDLIYLFGGQTMEGGQFSWSSVPLSDQGNNGDVAGDGVYSYRGPLAGNITQAPGFYNFRVFGFANGVFTYDDVVTVQVIDPETVSYVNRSGGTGLNYAGQPYSSVAIDFTPGPGPKDMFVSMLDEGGRLYKCISVSATGVPVFQSGTSGDTGGALPPVGILGLAVADFNNDGRDDLFVAGQQQGGARLYQAATSGNPVLQDVTTALMPSSTLENSLTGAWGDYDRDGRLDLFIGRGIVSGEPGLDSGTPASGVLLRNDTRSGGGFVDVSASTGIGALTQYAVTATWGDFNGDKFPDLFVGDASESGTASRLFRNGKDGGFVDEANSPTISRFGGDLNSVVGAGFADVDADGSLDLIVASRTGAEIRRNTNSGTYTTIVPVGTASTVSGLSVYDFDYNGVQDVLLLSGGTAATPRLFKGTSSGGSLSFSDVTSAVGLNWSGKVGGCVLSDFNSDGDLDLYLGRAVAGGAHFFTAAGIDPATDAYTQNWQQVQLVSNIGVPNSYRGIGAKVTVTQGANSFVRVVDGGSGRGGQADNILEFGLPTSTAVSNIKVEWPNGYVQNYASPPAGLVTIVDDTKLFAITRISGGHEIVPCTDLSRWTFSWVTSVGTNPDLDRVVYKIGDSNVFSGGTEVAATDSGVAHASYVKSTGTYQHDFSFIAPCALGQTVYFAVISKGDGEVIGSTNSFAITVCGTPCDPNQ